MEIAFIFIAIAAAVSMYLAGAFGAYKNTSLAFLAALQEVEREALSRERTSGPDAAAQFSDAAIVISDTFSRDLERRSRLFRKTAETARSKMS